MTEGRGHDGDNHLEKRGINPKGTNTADTVRSNVGKGSVISASGQHGGGDRRADAEDRLDTRLLQQREKAEEAARKALESGVVVEPPEEGDKIFVVDGVAYPKNIWGYFLSAVDKLKKKK